MTTKSRWNYIAAYANAAAAPPTSQGAWVIIGAAALLELELELLPLWVAAEAPEEVDVVSMVLPVDVDVVVNPVESVETMVEGAAEGFVGRAPAVNVTSCPPRADPPSVKVVVVPVMVVVEPVISATPDPEHVPLNEDVIVQPNEMLSVMPVSSVT